MSQEWTTVVRGAQKGPSRPGGDGGGGGAGGGGGGGGSGDGPVCYHCQQPGHLVRDCPTEGGGGRGRGRGQGDRGGYQATGGWRGGGDFGGGHLCGRGGFRGVGSPSRGGSSSRESRPPKLPYRGPNMQPYDIKPNAMSTDTVKALEEVEQYAKQLIKSDGSLTLKQPLQVKYDMGLRTGFSQANGDQRVATNYLAITPPPSLYVYKVEMIRDYAVNTNRPIPVKRYADKKAVMDALPALVPQLQHLGRPWATDGDLIWSVDPLFHHTGPAQVAALQNINYRNECGHQLNVQDVEIFYRQTIDCNMPMSELYAGAYTRTWRESTPAILMRGLNAFFTSYAHSPLVQQSITFTGANKAYLDNSNADLGRAHTPIRRLMGFFLSARPAMSSVLLNVNNVSSPFYPRTTVDEVVRHSGHPLNQLKRVLRGVKVRITYDINGGWQPQTNLRFINDVGNTVSFEPCTDIQNVNPSNGRPFTVGEWFEHTRAHPLFPLNHNALDIPQRTRAIKVAPDSRRTSPNIEWYPATLLEIVGFQPFHGDLLSDETTSMIENAKMDPDQNARRILTQGLNLFGFNITPNQGNLGQFNGMQTINQFISIPAHWLNPPNVTYNRPQAPAQRKIQSVSNASWNLQSVHFVNASPVHYLPSLNVSTALPAKILGFQQTLRNQLIAHNLLQASGPQFTNQDSLLQEWQQGHANSQVNYVDNYETGALADLNRVPAPHRQSPLLVLLDDKHFEVYACIKRMAELHLGMKTIFCTTDKKNFNPQNGSNIALKYNLKGRGTNHVLGATDFGALRPTAANGNVDTIVIGADVTHPGAGCSPGTPSIACVVGSTDNDFMHFPGSMRLQRGRKEYIIELGDMVKERLLDWAANHGGQLPRRMLFYRDGVAESQYQKLRSFEMPQIQKAYNWAREYLSWDQQAPGAPLPLQTLTPAVQGRQPHPNQGFAMDPHRDPWPPVSTTTGANNDDDEDEFDDRTGLREPYDLTYVVVGKRHNTRFYPLNINDKVHKPDKQNPNQTVAHWNVRPGLVIDRVITHPHSFDFYLQSHDPLHGTGRSAHYFVLRNNMQLTTTELQEVTHDFCYGYATATKGVSYCAPAYYADRLCDRGRAYLRHWLKNMDAFQPPRPRAQNESPQDYNDDIKNYLRDNAYWRPYHNRAYPTNPGGRPPMKYGFTRRNPWHEDLDDMMFYL
ncbi:hypothetical protein LTR37_009780 [Vermiconidia calcicola]|uniref:Uncharacterized protein n=1 Tax=Vermiconidia calcicola TaxID=1690605 RepID=A0ACC3N8B1_9PEZI|nr:hypothetical protein LTR37_009780 [Vermiconidia calcicola]